MDKSVECAEQRGNEGEIKRETGTKNAYIEELVGSEGRRTWLSKPFPEHPENEFDLASGGQSRPPFVECLERA